MIKKITISVAFILLVVVCVFAIFTKRFCKTDTTCGVAGGCWEMVSCHDLSKNDTINRFAEKIYNHL